MNLFKSNKRHTQHLLYCPIIPSVYTLTKFDEVATEKYKAPQVIERFLSFVKRERLMLSSNKSLIFI